MNKQPTKEQIVANFGTPTPQQILLSDRYWELIPSRNLKILVLAYFDVFDDPFYPIDVNHHREMLVSSIIQQGLTTSFEILKQELPEHFVPSPPKKKSVFSRKK